MDEDEPVYKLIHAIDPSKVNVPIRDRFAKLTLSSNKKKKEIELRQEAELQDNPQQLEKRQSASRNLLELLTASQGHAAESGATKYVNPLLRSDSSSKSSSGPQIASETQLETMEFEQENINEILTQQSEMMERLLMSEDECSLLTEEGEEEDNMAQQIAALSQQVSALTVSSKPSAISATPSSHELTTLVSTESQKMSSGELLCPSQAAPKLELTNARPPPVQLYSEISIVVASSTEEDDEVEIESAITISDSTSSLVSPDDAATTTDYDAITSIIPQSGETGDALLPNTFSNEKADRLEAFLRDVSQEFREMTERQITASQTEDTIAETAFTTTEESTPTAATEMQVNIPPVAVMTKAQKLRVADTESMSADTESMNAKEKKSLQTKENEREQRLLALGDTMPMSQSHSSLFEDASSVGWKTPRASEASNYRNASNRIDDDAKRLAQNETEANTLISFVLNKSNESFTSHNSFTNEHNNSTTNNSTQHSIVAPEESIVISETSSEGEQTDDLQNKHAKTRTPIAKTPTSRTPTFKTNTAVRTPKSATPTTSNEIVVSEELVVSDDSDSPIQSQLSQIQMSMGSINISAKINIKIHISQQISSDEEESQQSTVSEANDNDDNNRKKPASLPSTEESSNSIEQINKKAFQVSQKPKTTLKVTNPATDEDVEEAEVEDGSFLSQAEKMLNQLYGNSWQTPDVVRTLRRTSASDRKTSSSKKPVAVIGKQRVCTAETPKSIKNKKSTAVVPPAAEPVEESILLDDFSIFRRNIVKTNLDSTRLLTPKQRTKSNAIQKPAIAISTEPRRQRPATQKAESNGTSIFKVPQTEVKRPKQAVLTSRNRRVFKARNQQLIDSDSEDSIGDNASDDSDANLTNTSDRSVNSDNSWKKVSESDDSDFEIEEPTKRTARTKRQTKTTTTTSNGKTRGVSNKKSGSNDDLVYLDLSQNEVSVLEGTPGSPPANHDETFSKRLQDILRTCRPAEKPKLDATPKTTTKPKRKLFTAVYSYDDDENLQPPLATKPETPPKQTRSLYPELVDITTPINKRLESIKNGKPIFKVTPPRSNGKIKPAALTNMIKDLTKSEYSFLKSLETQLCKSRCNAEAVVYRENYRLKKEELALKLYNLYNAKIFDNRLNVPLIWNKKLINTAGRCLNRKKLSIRSCSVELSEKVLSTADRLRCTLLHELCHAATWIFSGEGGHGETWKEWARKSNSIFPELPKISRCHNYEIEYKYTYKCTLCAAKSHAHSKSKKVENIRCCYCHGAIEIFLNKKDKDGNVIPTPVREPTGFAKFVKENYKQHKRDDRKHADVMKLLSNEFAALKVAGSAN